MYFKLAILAAFAAIAAGQSGYGHHEHHTVDYHHPPHYQYKFDVHDHEHGVQKHHHEDREGDITHGEYSLVEPDGTTRTVKYTVDKHSGFNAEVIRSGHAQHPTHTVKHVPVVHHAPVHHSYGHY